MSNRVRAERLVKTVLRQNVTSAVVSVQMELDAAEDRGQEKLRVFVPTVVGLPSLGPGMHLVELIDSYGLPIPDQRFTLDGARTPISLSTMWTLAVRAGCKIKVDGAILESPREY
jgi:hypothetical protein